jgi:hypothetical protein
VLDRDAPGRERDQVRPDAGVGVRFGRDRVADGGGDAVADAGSIPNRET